MKKNGFTLIELMCVLVLLALLMAIAIPSALKLGNKVKDRTYLTKIDLIEQAAVNFGESNKSLVRKGTNPTNLNQNNVCTFEYDQATKDVLGVAYESRSYDENLKLGANTYWCSKITVAELVTNGSLDWDYENSCDNCTDEEKAIYDNTVINPRTNYIINNCRVFIYYRNSRIYAHFDKNECDKETDEPNGAREFRPRVEES